MLVSDSFDMCGCQQCKLCIVTMMGWKVYWHKCIVSTNCQGNKKLMEVESVNVKYKKSLLKNNNKQKKQEFVSAKLGFRGQSR